MTPGWHLVRPRIGCFARTAADPAAAEEGGRVTTTVPLPLMAN